MKWPVLCCHTHTHTHSITHIKTQCFACDMSIAKATNMKKYQCCRSKFIWSSSDGAALHLNFFIWFVSCCSNHNWLSLSINALQPKTNPLIKKKPQQLVVELRITFPNNKCLGGKNRFSFLKAKNGRFVSKSMQSLQLRHLPLNANTIR